MCAFLFTLVIDCGGLEDPDKGRVVLSGTVCGSTATYSCREGYTLVGDNTRTCQKDASWSGQAPFCTSKFQVGITQVQVVKCFLVALQLWSALTSRTLRMDV